MSLEARADRVNAILALDQILKTRDTQELEVVVRGALRDPAITEKLLEGLTSLDDYYRYNCFQSLLAISEKQPRLLYPAWGRLAALLKSPNAYQRNIGIALLANLIPVDDLDRFEDIFDDYFALLDDESLIPARFLAHNAGKIARFKPAWQGRITDVLLSVEASRQKQKELLKADVIDAFDEYFDESKDKSRILDFVSRQTDSSSPKTKHTAIVFLKKRAG